MGFFSDLSKDPAEPVAAPVAEVAAPPTPVPTKAKVPRKKAADAELLLVPPTREAANLPTPRILKPGAGPVIHDDLLQGTDEWLAARCGLLTASEMKLIITPSLKIAANEKERTHLYELLAQRITKHVEPTFVSADMERGQDDEDEMIALYDKHYAMTEKCGFITNDKWGFTIGYSPDGLVGTEGLIEGKSRKQKFQVETFVVNVAGDTVPADFIIQVQTGLLVSERLWCDFLSYSGGLPLARIRAYPDEVIQGAILDAAEAFERRLAKAHDDYLAAVASSKAISTKRRPLEIYL